MFAVTLIVAVAVLLSLAARWINPASYGAMSALGLLMPPLFILNFICLLFWIIRWKKTAFIPLALFLITVWGISMFFRPALTLDHSDRSLDRSLVSVVSYNVRGMMAEADRKKRLFVSSMDSVIAAIDSLNPAILCIQEFQSTRDFPRQYFEHNLHNLHYAKVRYNIGGDGDHGWGTAIFSRFPIVKSGHIDFPETSNSVIWADLSVNRDTVRVFNAHLQTTSITASDEDYIVNMGFMGDSTRTTQIRKMLGKLADNYTRRAGQADTLARRIAASPYPVIVCGDFNDTPVSFTYRKISHGLKDCFRESGRGYGYTFRGFLNLLRIDYILHSREIECVEYVSPDFDCSDHNPVAVKMRINSPK